MGHSCDQTIRFLLDGEVVSLSGVDPARTVLQYLREDLGRTGSKEGCAEGDCGACTVVLAEDQGGRLKFRAVNACIQFLPTLDGRALLTVESLKGADGGLHPVQQALVDCHGSQCGFCTPGFAMSLFALYKNSSRPGRREIDDALAGNLCRCTGYRPIVEAAVKMYDYGADTPDDAHWMNCSFSHGPDEETLSAAERETLELLGSLKRREVLALEGAGKRYFAPATVAQLAQLVEQYPQATLLAGGTDVGLWVTKDHRDLETVIYLAGVAELRTLEEQDGWLEIGAGVSVAHAMPAIIRHYPDLEELFRRFASPPIRNAATLGGNIANGSPIGDSMPALLALGTTLVLRKGDQTRELALEDYYLGYRQTARQPGEFLERIRIPLPAPGALVRAYKISKRFDQDISAVCAAFRLELDGEVVKAIRTGFGGMAPIPKRARHLEAALQGQPWSEETVLGALEALDQDFEPITDMRASRDYRQQVARNLLRRLYLETAGQDTPCRVYDLAR